MSDPLMMLAISRLVRCAATHHHGEACFNGAGAHGADGGADGLPAAVRSDAPRCGRSPPPLSAWADGRLRLDFASSHCFTIHGALASWLWRREGQLRAFRGDAGALPFARRLARRDVRRDHRRLQRVEEQVRGRGQAHHQAGGRQGQDPGGAAAAAHERGPPLNRQGEPVRGEQEGAADQAAAVARVGGRAADARLLAAQRRHLRRHRADTGPRRRARILVNHHGHGLLLLSALQPRRAQHLKFGHGRLDAPRQAAPAAAHRRLHAALRDDRRLFRRARLVNRACGQPAAAHLRLRKRRPLPRLLNPQGPRGLTTPLRRRATTKALKHNVRARLASCTTNWTSWASDELD